MLTATGKRVRTLARREYDVLPGYERLFGPQRVPTSRLEYDDSLHHTLEESTRQYLCAFGLHLNAAMKRLDAQDLPGARELLVRTYALAGEMEQQFDALLGQLKPVQALDLDAPVAEMKLDHVPGTDVRRHP